MLANCWKFWRGKILTTNKTFKRSWGLSTSAVARPNGQPRQAGVARGIRGIPMIRLCKIKMIGKIRQNFTEASASVGLILATALSTGHIPQVKSTIHFSINKLLNHKYSPRSRRAFCKTIGTRRHFWCCLFICVMVTSCTLLTMT